MLALPKRLYESVTHWIGSVTGRYYFEDYVRVYPDGIAFNRFGIQRTAGEFDLRNFANHVKFYQFASQFVEGRNVLDVGCGSGYGARILREAKAKSVVGIDSSQQSIAFAKRHFGEQAEFKIDNAVKLNLSTDCFDVTISSEVLEHVKEYGKEEDTVREMKRVTSDGGLLILGTPNSELLENHGFSYDEISSLLERQFSQFCVFENALIPVGPARKLWERRKAEKNVGVIVSERIQIDDTVVPEGEAIQVKEGIEPGIYPFADHRIDTKLLHNTHSWVVVAINNKK